ncbi:MAG TPA: AAA family ATPase [Noviherbaspirillum sp.]|uniref:trifunctional serine/threonine-protein kinase/ATP-binding protein/sensor histidine kinase n=1 Tax=Noviherbaspirillum sp. TaxID=1926288 RepID=UPI002D4BF4B5|nr:AAA family ATPase [Noviherbaspirillum sp.]HYD95910.1 AAA family ATPase [Noviherbaspirillum sp.]
MNLGAAQEVTPAPGVHGMQVLHQSKHTRIFRRDLPDGPGSIICKEPIGTDAWERVRHERKILERLAGIDGVPRLVAKACDGSVIAMEDVAALPLLETLRGQAPDQPALLDLATRLVRIIAAVHRCGVIHQNINPANILLVKPSGEPVLIDFRLAATVSEAHPAFTHHRQILGTLAYISPEQTGRTARAVDLRTDLYSLGATLYELATGRRPFEVDDPLSLIHHHLACTPPAPVALAPSLHPVFSAIVMRLLEKEPDKRYQSADGLLHDLNRLRERLATGQVEAFPLGEHDFPLRLSPPSRLIGRQVEVATLLRVFERAMHGETRGVLVAGVPGVGKTALIKELRSVVTARRGWFVSGKYDQYRFETVAGGAVSQAMRSLGQLLLAEPQGEIARQREHILQSLGHNSRLLASLVPEFAALLGIEPDTDAGDPIEASQRLSEAALALLRAVVSPARPLVMVVDDLQWADLNAIGFVDRVFRNDDLHGLLLVGVYRDVEVDETHPLAPMLKRWEGMETAPLRLKLNNLPPADLSALLAEMLRLDAGEADKLAEVTGARTGGNPYDTVELVNALRHDGVLVAGESGWKWDPSAIRHYVGRGDVVDLLTVRIHRLPQESQALLEVIACLGGELSVGLLQDATEEDAAAMEARLAPILEDGLLVTEQGIENLMRFRHDRVQQAAYGRLPLARKRQLHLALARALAQKPDRRHLAAEQYLPAIDEVCSDDESRLAIRLLRDAAASSRLSNPVVAERFLCAALGVLSRLQTEDDGPLSIAIETEYHAVLYSLGRLEEADRVYRSLEHRNPGVLEIVKAACVQISSLASRGMPGEAVRLGLGLLKRLGWTVPEDDFGADVERRLDGFFTWVQEIGAQTRETTDLHVQLTAKLIERMVAPAFFHEPLINSWLVLVSQELWAKNGVCAPMLPIIAGAPNFTTAFRQDFRTGYNAAKYALAVGGTYRYEPETSFARFLFAELGAHWFEPLEIGVAQSQLARESLVRGGDLHVAGLAYYSSIVGLLDCAPALDVYAAEIEAGIAFATRTCNHHAERAFLAHRQLLRALRGATSAPGAFADQNFDEEEYLATLGANPMALAIFHILRAYSAAIFGDDASLSRHVDAAVPALPYIGASYLLAIWQLLKGISLARRACGAAAAERAALLDELDRCRDWMACRAADAPENFLHLLSLIEAERAAASDDHMAGVAFFDRAVREAASRPRPGHHALIAERAGLFFLGRGMEHIGQALLEEACRAYEIWGAHGKTQALRQAYAFLRFDAHPETSRDRDGISIDTVDMLSILRASQALSSETSLARLRTQVVTLLAEMTGATAVSLVIWYDEPADWFILRSEDETAAPVSVNDPAAPVLLPMAIFRYVERTRELLLIDDAARDHRFAHDPYLSKFESCSILVVPILSQGMTRAILYLENRLGRGAFTDERLDAISLIGGQLAVSLENALLYENLEQRVQERTRELRAAQSQLVSTARQAGMAEIATNVLHNVGNVLNSVNVAADIINRKVRSLEVKGLSRAVGLLDEHAADLGHFITSDRKGRMLPDYLRKLASVLAAEQEGTIVELEQLTKSIAHIKEIVAMQQSYACSASAARVVMETVRVQDLVEDALRMNVERFMRHQIKVRSEFADLPPLRLDKTRVLQILVNLVSNAKHAMERISDRPHEISLRVDATPERQLRIRVADNGEGISPENLMRIFSHGFTTRKDGHGFGLHSCVIAAKEMGGMLTAHSDGPDKGAVFTLLLPMQAGEDDLC